MVVLRVGVGGGDRGRRASRARGGYREGEELDTVGSLLFLVPWSIASSRQRRR